LKSLGPKRYVASERELELGVLGIGLWACPHCAKSGTLIGHGTLRGYSERGQERELRGRRVFCSNRYRRSGCGRTFSVKLATVLSGFVVCTLTLFCFALAVIGGLTRRAAWLSAAAGALSMSSGYRLWRRLNAAQSALRARLCREVPAPASIAREPMAQLIEHLAIVVDSSAGAASLDVFAAFQNRFEQGLFDLG
jgi:hypothetical protein